MPVSRWGWGSDKLKALRCFVTLFSGLSER